MTISPLMINTNTKSLQEVKNLDQVFYICYSILFHKYGEITDYDMDYL